ncbi:hypothetical protein KSP40_PGU003385 [Platanthera guangdongensis]|uniref:Uncharacterized protein n=1 Tax=Platanthera guangdongensis TaxID=2320717 RepID=A0ABR2MMW6_9ASPA
MGSGLLIIATRIIWVGAITALILLLLGASTLVLLHMLAVGRACGQSLRAVNRAAGFLGNGLSSDDLDNLLCFERSTQNGGGEDRADGWLSAWRASSRATAAVFCRLAGIGFTLVAWTAGW